MSSTSSCGPRTTSPGASTPVPPACCVEAERRTDPPGDRARGHGERIDVTLPERSACCAAGDVDRAPDAAADDEGGAQLVGDIGREEQVAVASAALRVAARDVVPDPDRHAPRRQP